LDAAVKTDFVSGQVDFALAVGSVEKTQAIVASWSLQQKLLMAFGLGIDYLFMPVYSTCLACACIAVAECGFLPTLGLTLAWSQWLAALFDAQENFGLMQILLSDGNEAVIQRVGSLGLFCTNAKFFILVLGLLYATLGGFATKCCRAADQSGDKVFYDEDQADFSSSGGEETSR